MRLFKAIEPLREGDGVVYVGNYVTRYHKSSEPDIGFVPATEKDLKQALREMTEGLVPKED